MGARGRWFESSYADYKQIHYQRVAQLVERTVRGGEVGGSFPLTLTIWKCPTAGGGVASKATGRQAWGFESLHFRYGSKRSVLPREPDV